MQCEKITRNGSRCKRECRINHLVCSQHLALDKSRKRKSHQETHFTVSGKYNSQISQKITKEMLHKRVEMLI
jgi:hypothetical protein